MSLSFTPVPTWRCPHATCIVSKKVAQKAVTRNVIKRRLREGLHEALLVRQLPGAIIVRTKRDAGTATGMALKRELTSLLSRASSR